MTFAEEEIAYQSQRLARIATVAPDGQLDRRVVHERTAEPGAELVEGAHDGR